MELIFSFELNTEDLAEGSPRCFIDFCRSICRSCCLTWLPLQKTLIIIFVESKEEELRIALRHLLLLYLLLVEFPHFLMICTS